MKKMDFLGGPPPPPPPTVIPLPPQESQLYSPTQVRTGELCTVHTYVDRTQKVTIRCTAQSSKLSSPKREIAKRTVDSLHDFPLVAKDSGRDSSLKVRPRTVTNFGKGILD